MKSDKVVNSIVTKSSVEGKKTKTNNKNSLPKNINEYRHVIDTFKASDDDVKWINGLREHKKVELVKLESGEPPFSHMPYHERAEKYKADLEKYRKDPKFPRIKANFVEYEHLAKRHQTFASILYSASLKGDKLERKWNFAHSKRENVDVIEAPVNPLLKEQYPSTRAFANKPIKKIITVA